MTQRRSVLRRGAALGLGSMFLGGVAWSRPAAPVRMVLPSASSDTLAVKLLLDTPFRAPPVLTIDGRDVPGATTDGDGYGWRFVQPGLEAGRAYQLALKDDAGAALRAPWTLSTLPAVDARPERFRVLLFTCAGGDEARGPSQFLPMTTRRALLDRALSFEPDLAIAIGDHVYWDQETSLKHRGDPATRAEFEALYRKIAWIDQDSAFDSETNRRSLNTVLARQIATLYEDRFAGIPLVFVADDHDYFENDNAGPWGYSFPPRDFILNLQRRAAAIAYPQALGRPPLGGRGLQSETVETVRIGDLLELAIFECRRGNAVGADARILFPSVETYLAERLRASPARHFVQVPSNPFGWTAGKLGEWYADGPPPDVTNHDKGYWQPGWFAQHQRLAAALGAQEERAAITISGDLHASGAIGILRSGEIDLSANPINAILAGPISTSERGFPSSARGAFPRTPAALEARELATTEERNGFTLVDAFRDRIEVRQFRWRSPESITAIASIEPHASFAIARRS